MSYMRFKKSKVDAWEKKFLSERLHKFHTVSQLAKHLNMDTSNVFRMLRKHEIKWSAKRGRPKSSHKILVDKP